MGKCKQRGGSRYDRECGHEELKSSCVGVMSALEGWVGWRGEQSLLLTAAGAGPGDLGVGVGGRAVGRPGCGRGAIRGPHRLLGVRGLR